MIVDDAPTPPVVNGRRMTPYPDEEGEHSLALPDGRRLAWAAYGPPAGRPVLFLAGAATGKSMTFASRFLHPCNVRLVTVDRPGMGASSPDPTRTLESTARDLVELVDHLSGEPIPVIAHSQGAPFGLALAATGAVRHLTLVSPADEVASEPVRGLLPAAERAVVDRVNANAPEAMAFLAGLGPGGMEALVLANSDGWDRTFYDEPSFRARYRRALTEGFANGGVGYATDTVLAMSPWNLDLGSLRCDVEIWIGERDHAHSPDHARSLAGRIPHSTRRVVPAAGGALLWTHEEAILRSALSGVDLQE